MQARRTLLFNNKEPWLKESDNEVFDIQCNVLIGLKFAS